MKQRLLQWRCLSLDLEERTAALFQPCFPNHFPSTMLNDMRESTNRLHRFHDFVLEQVDQRSLESGDGDTTCDGQRPDPGLRNNACPWLAG